MHIGLPLVSADMIYIYILINKCVLCHESNQMVFSDLLVMLDS